MLQIKLELTVENNHVSAEIICGNLDSDFNGTAQLILANLTVDPLKILLPQIGKNWMIGDFDY